MATGSTIKMTAAQFLQLGEDPPGVRLELVDGEVAVTPSPAPDHSFVIVRLSRILDGHVEANRLGQVFGDVDTILGSYDIRRPDLLFFRKDRLHLVGKTAMQGAPDLCVEILSPGSEHIDRTDKFELYRDQGVAFYWIIDPQRRCVEAYALRQGEYVQAGAGRDQDVVRLLPFDDLDIPLGKLWRPK